MTIDLSETDVLISIIKKHTEAKGGRGKMLTLGMFYDMLKEANEIHTKVSKEAIEVAVNQQVKILMDNRSDIIKA